MVGLEVIDRVAFEAAVAVLKEHTVSRVYTEFATDSEGHDALRVYVVVQNDKASAITGDEALDTLVRIKNEVRGQGDDRFTFVQFATEQELADSGDPES